MDTKDRPREKVALVINDGLLKAKRIIVGGIENLGDPTAQKINYLRNYFLVLTDLFRSLLFSTYT